MKNAITNYFFRKISKSNINADKEDNVCLISQEDNDEIVSSNSTNSNEISNVTSLPASTDNGQIENDPALSTQPFAPHMKPIRPAISAYPKGKQGTFLDKWYEDFSWLEYSQSKDA